MKLESNCLLGFAGLGQDLPTYCRYTWLKAQTIYDLLGSLTFYRWHQDLHSTKNEALH